MTAPPMWWDALRPSTQLADRVEIVTHVPMDARLRNELLIDIYIDLSESVAAAIYGPQAATDHVRPNFYSYATWGAHTVGVQLRRRWWPGRQRLARALEAGNARIVKDMGAAAIEFLVRERRVPSPGAGAESETEVVAERRDTHAEGGADAREPSGPHDERAPRLTWRAAGGPSGRVGEGAESRRPDATARRRGARRSGAGRAEGHPGVSRVALRHSFLCEPSCGLPRDVLLEAGCTLDDPVSDAIEKIRDHGFELYERAIRCRTDGRPATTRPVLDDEERRTRDRLVLLGNAWLALSEQALIQDDVAVAARVNVRRWLTSPRSRLSMSQRQWRERPVGGWRLKAEHGVGRWRTRRLRFHHPPGTDLGGPGGSAGSLPIADWYERARSTLEPGLGSPFGIVADVPRIEYWPCLKQRTAAILVMMHALHADRWFVPHDVDGEGVPQFRSADLPERWNGYYPALGRLDRRLRAPLEHR